jgi:hypothetical protein
MAQSCIECTVLASFCAAWAIVDRYVISIAARERKLRRKLDARKA